VRHFFEERLQHLDPRLRAGDVADRNGDPLTRAYEVAKRGSVER
jgi:hypothetical protein